MMNLIIDANNLAYRCKYKFSLSQNGKDVSVTFGFLKILKSLINKTDADTVTVVWDYGLSRRRKEIYEAYKANRHKERSESEKLERDEFYRQMNELHDILYLFGVTSLRYEGIEADDIMYTVSMLFKGKNVIVSSDGDMLQAVTDVTNVYNPIKDKMYDIKAVEVYCGVPINAYVTWKALQGDSSDNIPGVRGIGGKTATKLLKKHKALQTICNAAQSNMYKDKKLYANINAFGCEKLKRNLALMELWLDFDTYYDIVEGLKEYSKVNSPLVRRYLMKNAFISLMNLREFYKLSCPQPKFV